MSCSARPKSSHSIYFTHIHLLLIAYDLFDRKNKWRKWRIRTVKKGKWNERVKKKLFSCVMWECKITTTRHFSIHHFVFEVRFSLLIPLSLLLSLYGRFWSVGRIELLVFNESNQDIKKINLTTLSAIALFNLMLRFIIRCNWYAQRTLIEFSLTTVTLMTRMVGGECVYRRKELPSRTTWQKIVTGLSF